MEAPESRNFFRLTRFILLKIPKFLRLLNKVRPAKKRILIVKTDAIGDYILFRNYIKTIGDSKKFFGYSIDLIGNTAWKDITLTYDKEHLNACWFINEASLYYKPWTVLKLGLSLFRNRYEYVIQPTYSKTLMSNGVAGLAAGEKIVAYRSKQEHHPKYKKHTDKLYTQLIELEDDSIHELEKNHFFIKTIIDNPELTPLQPQIPISKDIARQVVIFPGSSISYRNWPLENFASIIKRLIDFYDFQIILTGGDKEVDISNQLLAKLSSHKNIINKVGALTLPEFIKTVANSHLVISNETSAIHIAAACSTPCVSIVGGGHFKRFALYPEYLPQKPICVFQKMDCFYCNWNCKYQLSTAEPYPCIANVSIEDVWNQVKLILDDINLK